MCFPSNPSQQFPETYKKIMASEKAVMEALSRPGDVEAIRDLIDECVAQMNKFSEFYRHPGLVDIKDAQNIHLSSYWEGRAHGMERIGYAALVYRVRAYFQFNRTAYEL